MGRLMASKWLQSSADISKAANSITRCMQLVTMPSFSVDFLQDYTCFRGEELGAEAAPVMRATLLLSFKR